MALYSIVKVIPKPDYTLHLVYSDGKVILYDFKPTIQIGGLFERLKVPAYFAKVTIGEHGRYIEFPDELDFCADSLRMEGVEAAL